MHAAAQSRAVAWTLVAAWAALIFFMSAKSGLDLDSGEGLVAAVRAWLADVLSAAAGHEVDPSPIGHFGEYLVFGALLAHAFALHVTPGRAAAFAVAAVAVYAATDEFHQVFVPGRACDPADWAVDMAAALVAACAFRVMHRRGL